MPSNPDFIPSLWGYPHRRWPRPEHPAGDGVFDHRYSLLRQVMALGDTTLFDVQLVKNTISLSRLSVAHIKARVVPASRIYEGGQSVDMCFLPSA